VGGEEYFGKERCNEGEAERVGGWEKKFFHKKDSLTFGQEGEIEE
jgi:hypothetical protein